MLSSDVLSGTEWAANTSVDRMVAYQARHWPGCPASYNPGMMEHACNSSAQEVEGWMIRSSGSKQQDRLAAKALTVASLVT